MISWREGRSCTDDVAMDAPLAQRELDGMRIVFSFRPAQAGMVLDVLRPSMWRRTLPRNEVIADRAKSRRLDCFHKQQVRYGRPDHHGCCFLQHAHDRMLCMS